MSRHDDQRLADILSSAAAITDTRFGQPAKISISERPAASWPSTVLTGMRSLRMHGKPPIFA